MLINDIDEKSLSEHIKNIKDELKYYMLSDTTINGIEITKQDKLDFINIYLIDDKSNISNIVVSDNLNKLLKPSMNFTKIKKIALLIATIHIISAIFSFFEGYTMVVVSNNFAKELRSKISKKINKLPLKYFDSHSYGDILSRVTNDVDTINMSLHHSLGALVSSIALFFG